MVWAFVHSYVKYFGLGIGMDLAYHSYVKYFPSWPTHG